MKGKKKKKVIKYLKKASEQLYLVVNGKLSANPIDKLLSKL